MQHHHNKLWVQVMSHKYEISFDSWCKDNITGSYIWNPIKNVVYSLDDEYNFRIGANDFSFWYKD